MIDIRSRKIIANVKGKEIPFEEYYAFDLETNEEVFERNLELKNDLRLYDLYKESEGLLTSSDIKKIRNKYQMNQKEFADYIHSQQSLVSRWESGKYNFSLRKLQYIFLFSCYSKLFSFYICGKSFIF